MIASTCSPATTRTSRAAATRSARFEASLEVRREPARARFYADNFSKLFAG